MMADNERWYWASNGVDDGMRGTLLTPLSRKLLIGIAIMIALYLAEIFSR